MTRCLTIFLLLLSVCCRAEDGYRLWLRYEKIDDPAVLQQYRGILNSFYCSGSSAVLNSAKKELSLALNQMLGKPVSETSSKETASIQLITNPSVNFNSQNPSLSREGFMIKTSHEGKTNRIVITGQTDVGVLYGVFHLVRLMQMHSDIRSLSLTSIPRIRIRILNHWDNLNRTIERGYAGFSIWNWHELPDYIDQRYIDYARANASIGINSTVLTNVNANALVLTRDYLMKVAALANVFRAYGIRVYLTARFSAPIETGGLKTADPLDSSVRNWWMKKVNEIYQYIPDFGGFLVKANSEGQPGPQNYGRTHADGANVLADALAPHGGIVMWRAFVYSNETPDDRFRQAYNEFMPLDGKFRSNVLVQVKNGPIDFQPREPFSPLFGAIKKTPLMMEFQITQEYLGQGTHLVFEAPLFREVLDADTWQKGKGSLVSKIIDGTLNNDSLSGMAGVSNIGNDRNWAGHPFGQANWYAFGRLAWDPDLTATQIADEWIRQSFGNSPQLVHTISSMMLASREAVVNYMTPLGLHHIMGTGHHYGPAPWVSNAGRADWNPVYYHRADSVGIGFDRTSTGSNALAQYAPEVREKFTDLKTCPDEYLLWFHHLPWNYTMRSGRTLWDELCFRYQQGVDTVRWMESQWNSLKGKLDEERFNQVSMLLKIQEKDAMWWRNACLLYFQTFSKKPFPPNYEKPDHTLEYYRALRFPYAPGI
ncbi:MAG: alpha-glucuronidase family glycosyl hydrolase [Flavisolibacter sp.]